MYLTWPSFNNIRMLLMACMPIIIFYLIWLVNTSEAIRSEEGTLLDLVCYPDGNAIPVIIACTSIIAVVVELYGLYQLFKAGLPKREHDVTNGLFYYIWALIIMILIFLAIMFYSGLQSTIIRAKIKGGITKAMLRYSSHLPSKVAIDRLQTRFECCGRVSYQEWFYIPWFANAAAMAAQNQTDRKFVGDNVPYSCCSMVSLCPCIHHGITRKGTVYRYNPNKELTIWLGGCEEKLINEMMSVSWRFNAVMALIIIAMLYYVYYNPTTLILTRRKLGTKILSNKIGEEDEEFTQSIDASATPQILQVVAVRYLHTAYRNGLHIGNQIVSNAYLLRSVTEHEEKRPSKRKLWRRKPKHTRTLQWVAGGQRRYFTSSASDLNSSDELLKPIDE